MDIIVQIVLVIVTTATSYFIVKEIAGGTIWGAIGAICGLALGYVIIKLESKLKEISLMTIVCSLAGVMISLLVAHLFISQLLLTLVKDMPITLPIYILFYFIMGYLGFKIGKEKSKTVDLSKVPLLDKMESTEDVKILDTSTIIDGRIADICDTGFLEGTFIIPSLCFMRFSILLTIRIP